VLKFILSYRRHTTLNIDNGKQLFMTRDAG
jgi:hypothetical protein